MPDSGRSTAADRRAAALRGANGRDRQRDIGPILAGGLHDLGPAHEFKRGCRPYGGVEPRVIRRRPTRTAHRVGDAQQHRRSGRRRQVDPDLELLGGVTLRSFSRRTILAIDVALLDFGGADRIVGGGDLFGDGRERGAPFG